MPRRSNLPGESKRRQLEGSQRGAESVRSDFASATTRRRFCELVAIHPTTLKKWEKQGVLRPRLKTILNSPTRVFSEEDVEFGRRLIALLRARPGEFSLEEAAAISRRDR